MQSPSNEKSLRLAGTQRRGTQPVRIDTRGTNSDISPSNSIIFNASR